MTVPIPTSKLAFGGNDFALDDTHAIMSKEAFEALHVGIPECPMHVGMIWRDTRSKGFVLVDTLTEVAPDAQGRENHVDLKVREILVVK